MESDKITVSSLAIGMKPLPKAVLHRRCLRLLRCKLTVAGRCCLLSVLLRCVLMLRMLHLR